jgi:hypothetical protein
VLRTETPEEKSNGIRKDEFCRNAKMKRLNTHPSARPCPARGEPLEVLGNENPRHMTASFDFFFEEDRIRLIGAMRKI